MFNEPHANLNFSWIFLEAKLIIIMTELPKCGILPGLAGNGHWLRLRSTHASSIIMSLAYPCVQFFRGISQALEMRKWRSVWRAVELGRPRWGSNFSKQAQILGTVSSTIIIGVAASWLGQAMWGAFLSIGQVMWAALLMMFNSAVAYR